MSNEFRMKYTLEEQAQAALTILTDVYGQSPWTYDQIVSDMIRPDTEYVYDYEDEEIVGFLALQHLVGETEVTNIAVLQSYQGQGIGARLMKNLTEITCPIFLEVRESNASARSLYQKSGFKEVGKRKDYYHDPVENAIVMVREDKV